MLHDTDISTVRVVPLLWVTDLEKSIRFYQKVGFKITESWKPKDKIQWCRVEFYDAALMLQETESSETQQQQRSTDPGIQLYFITDEIDVLYQQMCANGIDVSAPKIEFYGMKQVFLSDPDGRTLCFESLVST